MSIHQKIQLNVIRAAWSKVADSKAKTIMMAYANNKRGV